MQRQTHSPVSSSDACRSSAQDADSLVEGAQTPVCVKCGKHFFRQNELRRHIRTVHEREKTHKCPHCLKLFSQSSHLVTHVRSVHERRMDFPCNICKYRFSVRSNQLKHMRRKHGEDTASRVRSRSRSTSPGCQNSGSGNEMDTSLTRGNSTEEQQED
ncbi:Protein glass [Porphyridium purpureum]|uniref:Protein glass n=1 Tax=Porphyridium purpureum TaxID=35688 RepID=A0A5J4YXY7_PORPP|nr:Protein glass [Porphyridium purpureum]|eukprot:POR4103..scf209_3